LFGFHLKLGRRNLRFFLPFLVLVSNFSDGLDFTSLDHQAIPNKRARMGVLSKLQKPQAEDVDLPQTCQIGVGESTVLSYYVP
jgi:hypothetical protein